MNNQLKRINDQNFIKEKTCQIEDCSEKSVAIILNKFYCKEHYLKIKYKLKEENDL
tara:strand:- start:4204 stop:4371 length:168 start_codon:yes stop_codon:yes gene_type:complete